MCLCAVRSKSPTGTAWSFAPVIYGGSAPLPLVAFLASCQKGPAKKFGTWTFHQGGALPDTRIRDEVLAPPSRADMHALVSRISLDTPGRDLPIGRQVTLCHDIVT